MLFIILFILFYLHLHLCLYLFLYSLIIPIIRSILKSEDTTFSVKITQRSRSLKEGLYLTKSSIKPHLRRPHVN
jgi:hypothetical protein